MLACLHLDVKIELLGELSLGASTRDERFRPKPQCASVHLTPIAALGRLPPRTVPIGRILPGVVSGRQRSGGRIAHVARAPTLPTPRRSIPAARVYAARGRVIPG